MQPIPFTLATIRSEGQFNSIIYEENDSYRQTETRWCVLMNQSDIDRLQLDKVTKVTMRSESGEMRGLTVYPFDVPSGNVLAYYPEANILTTRVTDPRSKTPSFKSVPVELFKEL